MSAGTTEFLIGAVQASNLLRGIRDEENVCLAHPELAALPAEAKAFQASLSQVVRRACDLRWKVVSLPAYSPLAAFLKPSLSGPFHLDADGSKDGAGRDGAVEENTDAHLRGKKCQAALYAVLTELKHLQTGSGGDAVRAREEFAAVKVRSKAPTRELMSSNATTAVDPRAMDILVGGTLDDDLTAVWLLMCAFLVFFMQAGFALLEAGSIRSKNVKNILLKNVIDACVAALAWWALGYPFAYGNGCGGNGFIGASNFFSANLSSAGPLYYANFFFGYSFCATAATIVSGAVAERIQFRSYVLYTVLMSAFIYPVVVHWVWSQSGWLSGRRVDCATGAHAPTLSRSNGVLDFAGSGVVHMVGGAVALVGAVVTGPRLGRFKEGGIVARFENTNTSQMVLGTLILWLGWYGFNAGSTGCMYGCMHSAAQAAVNTTLSIAAGGLTCLLLAVLLGAPGDIGVLLNGILAGAVSATANCALVEPYAAVIIGAVGACVYTGASALLLKLQIDDPLDASPVHLFCGAWGVTASGLFATESSVTAVYGYANGWGAFYGGGGVQFGVQLLGVLCIWAWCTLWGTLMFLALQRFGALRVPQDDELQGLDMAQGMGTGEVLGVLRGGWFGTKEEAEDVSLARRSAHLTAH